MTAPTETRVDGPAMVAAMAEVVAAESEACEQLRTLTPPVVESMWSTGLMTHFNPVEAGGADPTFPEMIQTWIDMATLDGSFGWIGIANLPSAAAIAAYLPEAGFDEVFTANDNHVTLGGSVLPQRCRRDRRRRLSHHRRLELRLRHGAQRIRRRGVHAHGRRRAGHARERAP